MLKRSLIRGVLLPLLLTAVLCVIITCGGRTSRMHTPRNIILLIGDGMGVSQVTAGKTVKGTISLERFGTAGLITTHSADDYVTDSAAGGTALATGYKTKNGMIAMSPDSVDYKTVLEYARARGYATGLVTTCSITHATPAAFCAHTDNRNKQTDIAVQIAASGADVLFGGGYGYFLPKSSALSLRTDDKDLMAQFRKEHRVIWTPAGLDSLDGSSRAVGLFYRNHPPASSERNYRLSTVTEKALSLLAKNTKGFFLMVEGSQIDWAGHENSSSGIIDEFIDFDDAAGAALDWALEHGETLVLVTADHETGGYALEGGSIADRRVTRPDFTTGGHTGTMVPLFAEGPASGLFSGIHDNTHIGATLISFFR